MVKERENRIDLIRGLSLLLIFVGHANFSFSEGLQHSRGFSDASELFVLMAGISAALAYYPRTGIVDLRSLLAKPLRRARKIYAVHVALILVLVGLFSIGLASGLPLFVQASATLELTSFWSDPSGNLASIFLLRYMPGNFDILPMYVILIACVPFFLYFHDRRPLLLFGASGVVWLGAGFGHVNFVNTALPEGHWYFDPLSWQMIFLIGLTVGVRIKTGRPPLPYNRLLFIAAAAFCLLAIPINILFHFHFVEPPSQWLYRAMTSKTNDGILRLVNAVAILYVLWNIDAIRRMANASLLQPICVIGRHSMAVFVTGLLLSDLMTVSMALEHSLTIPEQILLMTTGLLLQLVVGQYLEARKSVMPHSRLQTGESSARRTGPLAPSSHIAG
ncbi:OpgC domain-containing protein (plasmid) [Rhizobium sp. 32-5/1]|uniref:OpgC family protein n=1 Tax=Rhizobium sp. 32-5/1 TaxID=3019602 RepID=UPI00240CEE52|nr:OpgC domain-containing protein [Rhizobium sp. 32-5/1]WEZ84177.1 OpgC domain-containing protein [Rhizobium sp. 32-5/1]WEZ85801.1 OpgC domain-containing protein [Rhizobium sp. 32-5/1]